MSTFIYTHSTSYYYYSSFEEDYKQQQQQQPAPKTIHGTYIIKNTKWLPHYQLINKLKTSFLDITEIIAIAKKTYLYDQEQ